jgi:hypothetical protein
VEMRSLKWFDYVLLALILVLIVQISRNLPLTYDESYHLQVPLRLLNEGTYNTIYPLRNYDGFSTIGVGPTILLPVSLVFKLFGVGILKARIVSCLYLLGLVSILWLICIKHHNRIWGAILIGLLLAIPTFYQLGITVVGEVPSLFFIILGIYFWKPNEFNFIALLCFGLSAITKLYILLFSFPIIFIIIFEGQGNNTPPLRWIKRIIISLYIFIIPTIIWEIAKYLMIGKIKYLDYLGEISSFVLWRVDPNSISDISPLAIGPRFILVAKQLYSEMPYWITGILFVTVILFYLIQTIKKNISNTNLFFYLAFNIYFFWFLIISKDGWWRHFFPFAIIFSILLLNLTKTIWEKLYKYAQLKVFVIPICAIIILFCIIKPIISIHSNIFKSNDLSAQQIFAKKVKELSELGYKFGVMGWWQAPEISFLSGGIKFDNIENNCDKLHKDKYLVIYTKLQETLAPDTAKVLRQCLGDVFFSSSNQWYILYQPQN